jgi:hypothetical protein
MIIKYPLTVIDVTDLFGSGLDRSEITLRVTAGVDPRVSSIDYVMAFTGQTNQQAATTIKKMKLTHSRYIFEFAKMHTFDGQVLQYVFCHSECMRVMLVLADHVSDTCRMYLSELLTRLIERCGMLRDL